MVCVLLCKYIYISMADGSGFEFGGRGRTRLLVRRDFEILFETDRFLGTLALTKSIGF